MSARPLIVTRPTLGLSTDMVDAETVVIRARGDLDGDTAARLTDLVDRVFAGRIPALLVLDLSGLEFMGAAGITALLHVRDVVADGGGRLVLREPSAPVSMVLRLGRAIALFTVEGTHIPHRIG